MQRKSHRNNDNSNRQTAKVSRNKVIVDFEKKYASVEGNPCLVCRPQSTNNVFLQILVPQYLIKENQEVGDPH